MNKEVLISTIGPKGEQLTPEQAREQAKRTGKNLGVFNSPEEADKYADSLEEK